MEPNSVAINGTQSNPTTAIFDYDTFMAKLTNDLNSGNMSLSDYRSGVEDANYIRDSQATGLSKFLKDPNMMSNVTGLASTLLQAAALPTLMKQAKLQNQSLQFNLDTARDEQARRNRNISAFNQVRV